MNKISLAVLVLSVLLFSGCAAPAPAGPAPDSQLAAGPVDQPMESAEEPAASDTRQLSPEEVLTRLDAQDGTGLEQGPITVAIISPEGEGFVPGQARMYKAEIDGLVAGSRARCHWQFYLNQYDEEALYQEMDDESYPGDLCSFTQTFIRDRGDLRVHVDVDVTRDDQEGVVQTGSADRMYRVQ